MGWRLLLLIPLLQVMGFFFVLTVIGWAIASHRALRPSDRARKSGLAASHSIDYRKG